MLRITWVFISVVAAALAVPTPPSIFLEPDYEVFYNSMESVTLPCEANGDPKPEYRWTRNNIDYYPNPNNRDMIAQIPGKGTIVMYSGNEGIYQCFATNSFGTSVSKKINLRQTKLGTFAPASPMTFRLKLGESFTLPCVPPESVPPARVLWIQKDEDSGGSDIISYDSRVSMDREYGLRFTNIKATDYKVAKFYACVSLNQIMRRRVEGPRYYIRPAGTIESYREVGYMWSDDIDRFGLRGETFSIKCIFSGNPTPDVHWERTDNKSLPDRAIIRNFGQELEIYSLQFEDAGTYECSAINSVSNKRLIRSFTIRVNSKPYFIQEPTNINISVGADAEFNCTAGGDPEPDIGWLFNGVALKDVTDPRIGSPRFRRPQENQIILENIQLTDRMVIQCNASNIHGYILADFYLNVL